MSSFQHITLPVDVSDIYSHKINKAAECTQSLLENDHLLKVNHNNIVTLGEPLCNLYKSLKTQMLQLDVKKKKRKNI